MQIALPNVDRYATIVRCKYYYRALRLTVKLPAILESASANSSVNSSRASCID